jgi:hypothetical protein
MNLTNDPPENLPPLPRGMFWRVDGRTADRAALTQGYEERLRLINLVRLTAPGSLMHERAKVRLAEIERADHG